MNVKSSELPPPAARDAPGHSPSASRLPALSRSISRRVIRESRMCWGMVQSSTKCRAVKCRRAVAQFKKKRGHPERSSVAGEGGDGTESKDPGRLSSIPRDPSTALRPPFRLRSAQDDTADLETLFATASSRPRQFALAPRVRFFQRTMHGCAERGWRERLCHAFLAAAFGRALLDRAVSEKAGREHERRVRADAADFSRDGRAGHLRHIQI